jgi:hypothetical protein
MPIVLPDCEYICFVRFKLFDCTSVSPPYPV